MFWNSLRALIAIVAAGSPALADPSEFTADRAWRDCVMAKAAQYAKGPDAAPLIVSAALSACFDKQKDYAAVLPASVRLAMLDILNDKRRELSEEALIVVLERRSAH